MTRQSRGRNERGIEVVGGFRMMNVGGVLSWDTWETRSGILFGGSLRSGCVLDGCLCEVFSQLKLWGFASNIQECGGGWVLDAEGWHKLMTSLFFLVESVRPFFLNLRCCIRCVVRTVHFELLARGYTIFFGSSPLRYVDKFCDCCALCRVSS